MSKEPELKVRDTVVLRMKREGAVEENLESPVPMSFEDIPGGAKGFFSPVESRIAIQEGMSEIQTVKTAIHEIAHAKLHAFKPDEKATPEDKKDRHTKEVEAERDASPMKAMSASQARGGTDSSTAILMIFPTNTGSPAQGKPPSVTAPLPFSSLSRARSLM